MKVSTVRNSLQSDIMVSYRKMGYHNQVSIWVDSKASFLINMSYDARGCQCVFLTSFVDFRSRVGRYLDYKTHCDPDFCCLHIGIWVSTGRARA